MRGFECENCFYYWQEPDDEFATCHWEPQCPGDMAPCDYDEEDE